MISHGIISTLKTISVLTYMREEKTLSEIVN
jgi:hypothetical protein